MLSPIIQGWTELTVPSCLTLTLTLIPNRWIPSMSIVEYMCMCAKICVLEGDFYRWLHPESLRSQTRDASSAVRGHVYAHSVAAARALSGCHGNKRMGTHCKGGVVLVLVKDFCSHYWKSGIWWLLPLLPSLTAVHIGTTDYKHSFPEGCEEEVRLRGTHSWGSVTNECDLCVLFLPVGQEDPGHLWCCQSQASIWEFEIMKQHRLEPLSFTAWYF